MQTDQGPRPAPSARNHNYYADAQFADATRAHAHSNLDEEAARVFSRTEDTLPERAAEAELQLGLAREFIAKANVRLADATEQQAQANGRSSQRTQDLIAEANERADVAEQRADKADLQMATMAAAAAAADLAAALRVPRATLASVFEDGQPLPGPALPATEPGELHPASVAAQLQHQSAAIGSAYSTDSGSWDAASRADSFDSSNWDAGPLGAPQGSWDWFGSRSSTGYGGMPSHLRPVDDAVIIERRANKVVWPQPGSDPGSAPLSMLAEPNAGNAGPDVSFQRNSAHERPPSSVFPPTATGFRRPSDSDNTGLPPAAPAVRRPSNSGSDAVRRASFGRLAHRNQQAQQHLQAQQRGQLPPFSGGDDGEA